MPRKTFEVEKLRERANVFLAAPSSSSTADDDASQRLGVLALLESVLFETDNYKGFQYLESEYLPADQQTADQVLRPGHDGTRRRYF